MAITYTPTTNFGAKDSLPTNDPDKVIKGSEFTTEFTAIQTAFSLAAPAASPTFTGTVTIPTADINGGAIDGTVIGGATPAAGSFTSLTATGTTTLAGASTTADITFGDNDKAVFGAGSDLQIFHNGSRSVITDQGTGPLRISATNLEFKNADDTKLYANATDGGAFNLYYDNAAKLSTTSTGIAVTGDATFADNGKAVFGAGSDLQIYHDASLGQSRIQDVGTGSLYLQGDGGVVITNSAGTSTSATFASTGATSLSFNGATKFATTSTGIDVTGTVTADGLTVDGNSYSQTYRSSRADGDVYIQAAADVDFVRIGTQTKPKLLNIDGTGDISFYEDTGTTPKLFWDASEESLNIGTTSGTADRRLHITGTGPSTAVNQFGIVANPSFPTSATANVYNLYTGPNLASGTTLTNLYNLYLEVNNITGSTVTNSFGLYQAGSGDKNYFAGNVGIGISSPTAKLHILADTPVLMNNAAGTSEGKFDFVDSGATLRMHNFFGTGSNITFLTNPNGGAVAERMRIDSSGNLLVGTTSTSASVAGGRIFSTGRLVTSVDNEGHYFRRNTSDGTIVEFAKDGTTVGSIGTDSNGQLYIGEGDTGLGFQSNNDALIPRNTSGAARDGAINLGTSGARFKDLYLSGGVYLGGTGAANKLDDYEEGTWTPSLSAATTNPTPTAVTVNNAAYTKIGNTVFIRAYINVNLTNAGSGGAQIEGLPFAVKSGTFNPVFFTHGSLIQSTGGYFVSGNTQIAAITTNDTAVIGFAGTGNRYLMISGQYETA